MVSPIFNIKMFSDNLYIVIFNAWELSLTPFPSKFHIGSTTTVIFYFELASWERNFCNFKGYGLNRSLLFL